MSSTGTTSQSINRSLKRPAPTTEIQESELGSLVSGILSKASAPAAKIAKTATEAKKVTAKVKEAPIKQVAPATKLPSPPKPSPQATRKIAIPRPATRKQPLPPSSNQQIEIKQKHKNPNVEIIKFAPNIRVIPVTKFEKVALTKIAANPKQYPHITMMGKDERGWTVVRRLKIDTKELEKLRKEEKERQREKEREQELAAAPARKSMIERARQKLVEEEQRILRVQKEAEEAGARRRSAKEADRKERQLKEKQDREKRAAALRAMRNA